MATEKTAALGSCANQFSNTIVTVQEHKRGRTRLGQIEIDFLKRQNNSITDSNYSLIILISCHVLCNNAK
jgi:hypothetical protein